MLDYKNIDWSINNDRYVLERVLKHKHGYACIVYRNLKNNKKMKCNTTDKQLWYYRQFIGATIA